MHRNDEGAPVELELKERASLHDLMDDDRRRSFVATTVWELRRATTLEAFLTRRVGKDDAQDIAQEAYFRFFTSSNANSHNLRHPAGYLFRIGLNVLSQHRHRKARDPVCLDPDAYDQACTASDDQWEDVTERLSAEEMVRNICANLPPRFRSVLVLRYMDGYSHEQIAKKLGIAKKSVPKYIDRALGHARTLASISRW